MKKLVLLMSIILMLVVCRSALAQSAIERSDIKVWETLFLEGRFLKIQYSVKQVHLFQFAAGLANALKEKGWKKCSKGQTQPKQPDIEIVVGQFVDG
jgi:hypothetical protein